MTRERPAGGFLGVFLPLGGGPGYIYRSGVSR